MPNFFSRFLTKALGRTSKKNNEEDQRLRIMMDAIPAICTFWDENRRLVYCNQNAAELFELDSPQAYIDRFAELSPTYQPCGISSFDHAMAKVNEAFEHGRSQFEWMHQKPSDGSLIPAEISLVRVNWEDGYGLVGFTHDKRETMNTLNMLNAILDKTPLLCTMFDEDKNVIDTNQRVLDMFGLSNKQEFIDRFSDFMPEFQPNGLPSQEQAIVEIEQAFESGHGHFEWMHQTADGQPIPAEVYLERIMLLDKQFVVAYVRDLREHAKMMADIRHKDNLLTIFTTITVSLLESTPETFNESWVESMGTIAKAIDVERIYLFKSRRDGGENFITQLCEWSKSVESNTEYVADVPCSEVIPNWIKKLVRGEVINGPIEIMQEAEQRLMNSQNIKSILLAPLIVHGVFWGFIGFDDCVNKRWFSDDEISVLQIGSLLITHVLLRNDMVENLGENAKSLEQALVRAGAASEAKSTFLSQMSHEIRTPMNTVVGMTHIGKTAKDMAGKDYAFGKIEAAANHLLGVINDILDMSKIESGKFELFFTEFFFEKAIRKAIDISEMQIAEKRQRFNVYIGNNIPDSIIADEQKLVQVMTNLLSNAVKFTPHGGEISMKISLIDRKVDLCTIQVEVKDSGIGIEAENQAHIFTPFSQAEGNTSHNYGGTGLGLPISKTIVECMDGSIWVESEKGAGSTFAFTIRVKRGAQEKRRVHHLQNVKILFVDDDITMLKYIETLAGRFGWRCDTAASGGEALNLIENNGPYHIYFVDWSMPEMNGIELTRAIKEKCDAQIVIMVSSVEWTEIKQDATAAGLDGFLPKPVMPSSFFDCLNNYLGDISKDNEEFAASETYGEFRGRRILLAEDMESNREVLMALLQDTQVDIECAENGQEAVRMFAESPARYDLIFMDGFMPVMDGLEATRQIRALTTDRAKSIPIIAMTANVFQEDVDKCLDAGMNDHLGKPLDFRQVIGKMRAYL